MDVKITEPYRV